MRTVVIEPDFRLDPAERSNSDRVISEEILPGIHWRLVERRVRLVGVQQKPHVGYFCVWREWQGELLDIDRVTNDRFFKLDVPDSLEASRKRKGAAYPVSLPMEAVPPELRPQPPEEEEPEALPSASSGELDADALWARVVERVRRRSHHPKHVDAVIAGGKFVIRVSEPEGRPASVLFEEEWARSEKQREWRPEERVVATLSGLRDRLEKVLLELGLGPDSDGSGAFPHPYARFRYLCFRLEEVADFVNGEWSRFPFYEAFLVAVTFGEIWTELLRLADALRGRSVQSAASDGGETTRLRPDGDIEYMADLIKAGATLGEAALRASELPSAAGRRAQPETFERAYRRAREKDPSLPAPKRGRPRRTRTS